MKKYDVVIIGAGIIGASISYEIARYDLSVLVLEKNPKVANETSLGNSGLIHGGFDPDPAKKNEPWMNVEGNRKWQENWFKHLKFPRVKIDSLVLAFDEEDMKHVDMLYKRGLTNKVRAEDMKILTAKEVLEKEPNVNPEVKGALLCTSSVAIQPVEATKCLLGAAKQNGVELRVSSKVTDIKYNEKDKEFEITINNKDKVYARKVVDAAGHYADTMAQNFDDFKQKTRRGEYRIIDNYDPDLIHSVLFRVPTRHGKGVIVAPTLDGKYLVGPTAQEGVAKEDTRLVTREKYDYIGEVGTTMVPSIKMERTIMTIAGSRPIDIETDDFVIRKSKKNPDFVIAGGMQSPALSSAPIIASEVVKLLELDLKPKTNFNPDYEIDVY